MGYKIVSLKFMDSAWAGHINFSILHKGNIDSKVKIVAQVKLITLWQSGL